jgi:exodeoxyribonuclease (lambda-induced)
MPRNFIEPLSAEWFQARSGRFTASNFGKLIPSPKHKGERWSVAALNYINEKARERIAGGNRKSLTSKPVKWGTRMEASALKAFEKKMGIELSPCGFLTHSTIKEAGATPDGLILNDSGIEIALVEVKCPYNPKIHLNYYNRIKSASDLKKVAFYYYWQVQGAMWVYGLDLCYFVSFDSRRLDEKRLLVVEIPRNEKDSALLEKTLTAAISQRDELLQSIRQKEGKQLKLNLFQRLFKTKKKPF